MEKKKLKLTISGSSKKTINNIEIPKSQGKNSVIIEKKTSRFSSKSSFSKNNNQNRKLDPLRNSATAKWFFGSFSFHFWKFLHSPGKCHEKPVWMQKKLIFLIVLLKRHLTAALRMCSKHKNPWTLRSSEWQTIFQTSHLIHFYLTTDTRRFFFWEGGDPKIPDQEN